MLSNDQLDYVCLLDQGNKQCRYLGEEGGSYHCMKLAPNFRAKVDAKMKAWLEQQQNNNLDPLDSKAPQGDGCAGYIILKHKLQGYDIK